MNKIIPTTKKDLDKIIMNLELLTIITRGAYHQTMQNPFSDKPLDLALISTQECIMELAQMFLSEEQMRYFFEGDEDDRETKALHIKRRGKILKEKMARIGKIIDARSNLRINWHTLKVEASPNKRD
jgi:hypothetical protein